MGNIVDLSAIFKDQGTPTPPLKAPDPSAPSTGSRGEIVDLSGIFDAQPEKSQAQILNDQMKASRDAFYDRVGIPRGALRGALDIVPSALDAIGSIIQGNPEVSKEFLGGVGQALETSVQLGKEAVTHPIETAKKAPTLVGDLLAPIIKEPVELTLNNKISWSDYRDLFLAVGPEATEEVVKRIQATSLSPEEREQRGRSVTINALSILTGAKAEEVVGAKIAGQEAIVGAPGLNKLREGIVEASKQGILGAARTVDDPLVLAATDIDNVKLLQLARNSPKLPQFLADQVSGLAGGVVGGVTYGALNEGTPGERLAGAITMSVMAAPIGVTMSMMGHGIGRARGALPKVRMEDVIARQAAEIAKFRVLKNGIDQPLSEILFNNMNLQQQQRLSTAFALNAIEYTHAGVNKDGSSLVYGKNARIIPGVENPAEILSMVAQHNIESPYPDKLAVVHTRKDGMHDVLIAPHGLTAQERAFFEKTGYSRGQQVGFGGKENWVIEDANIPDGKRQYRMELRNIVTGERVTDARPRDIVRLSSNEPGDLSIYLGRYITVEDVVDPAQGFAHGTNEITRADMPQDPQSFGEFAVSHIREYGASDITGTVQTSDRLIDARNGLRSLRFLDEVNGIRDETFSPNLKRIQELRKIVDEEGKTPQKYVVNGQELKPGINHIYDARTGKGSIVYVGGAEVPVPTPTGIERVMVGQPGEIVSFLNYDTQPHGDSGRLVRGSQEFYSRPTAQNVGLANQAIKEARVRENVLVSHSSLSESGGLPAYRNTRNVFAPDRQVAGKLTVSSPEVLKKELLNAFLDHVGLSPDGNFIISGEELVRAGYTDKTDPTSWAVQAHPGESLNTMRERLETYRMHLYTEGLDVTPHVWDQSKRPLSMDEARELLKRQISEDAVPTVHQQMERAINFNDLSFNDMVHSFIEFNKLNPELGAAIHTFLQSQIGNILLDLPSAVSRLADRSTLPMLEGFVDRAERVLRELEPQEQHLNPSDTERLAEARKTRDVFQARVDQIKKAEPLPFSDSERQVLARLDGEAMTQRVENLRDLASVSSNNGLAVEYHDGGKIRLIDIETGLDAGHAFDSPQDAIDFINATGKIKSVDLDGGGNNMVPPSAVMGNMTPPGPPDPLLAVPHQFAPNTRVSAISQLINTVAPWYTPFREFAVALDNGFGSRLYSDVYLPTQTALMKLQAVRHPYMKLIATIDDLIRGTTKDPERRKLISAYRETMSPQEVIDKVFTHRKLNTNEVKYAQRLVDDQIRINDVYGYRRAIGEMRKGFESQQADLADRLKNAPDDASKQEISQKIVELNASHRADVEAAKEAFNMDDTHLKASDMFEDITGQDPDEASLYGVTRLARAIQNGEVSRAEFAAKNKMTSAELSAARQLDNFYAKVGKDQDMPMNLNGYLNHFRAYSSLPESTPAKFRNTMLRGALKEAPTIAAELIRSGEMNVYELDPIRAAVQYVNSVTANRHFNEVWTQARDKAVQELNKVTDGRVAATNVVEKYIYGIKGFPEASDKLGQAALDRFMAAIGSDLRPEIKRDLLNTWLSGVSGAYLGFRIAQGVRDFTQFSKGYYSRFGTKRYNNGLSLAFERDANGVMAIHKLAEDGTIPGLSVLPFLSENELANGLIGKAGSKAKDAIMNASRLGLDVSGQHNAYSLAHAIAYLDTRDLASKTLLELSRGKITKDVAYKRLSMNSYDIPVAEGFDRLVSEGKFDQATEYLAQSTGAETAFVFGLHNHPYGWGTIPGKIASMFGTWSVWDRTMLLRLAGRGTAAERAASMARFAMAETATGLAGKALGLNMRSWYMIPGMLFFGGPAFEYLQQFQDMMGVRGSKRQAVATKQLTTASDGKLPVVGNLMPGSMALSDYIKAYQLSTKHYGPVPILAQALGFSVDQTQRSWLDEMMGNRPQLKP